MKFPLENIPSVIVEVSGNLDMQIHRMGLDEVQQYSELFLRKSGVPVAENMTDNPVVLSITARALLVENHWSATLRYELRDIVVIARNRRQWMASIMSDESGFVCGFDRMPDDLRISLTGQLARACNELHRANAWWTRGVSPRPVARRS